LEKPKRSYCSFFMSLFGSIEQLWLGIARVSTPRIDWVEARLRSPDHRHGVTTMSMRPMMMAAACRKGGKAMKKYLLLIVIAASWVAASNGQKWDPGNAQIKVNEATTARTGPPSGPLNFFVGGKLGVVPRGTELVVVGKKSYGSFSGAEIWLEVEAKDQNATVIEGYKGKNEKFWIYGGKQDSTSVVPSGVTAIAGSK
jgi:hypothetical protein